ncbi:tRNA-splicing endonuclease subunit [Paecilomyces lecythidis]|uniref:tRNA-splicing endonuclease subunit Sen34 n=1 Tax=Paecilomyces lecythidis TaxID=3004212 RepID=A0ABR3WYJ9_9EURO
MSASKQTLPKLPIQISFVSGRYLLFSIDAVTYLRREHNICGVLIGTLPQIPQQNVFLGLPLELMPEEARLLVDKGVACIVDEKRAHNVGMKTLMQEDRRRYLQDLEHEGFQASRIQAERKEQQREEVLKNLQKKKGAKVKVADTQTAARGPVVAEEDVNTEIFGQDQRPGSALASSRASIIPDTPFGITPATSYPPLPSQPHPESLLPKPDVPASYPLYAHLHSKGYFLAPGLRFGCQYLAYPGDSLRFHSHFLVVAADWDEEIDLMDIIVGGRMGTGVKKGFLIGGAEKTPPTSEPDTNDSVRTFSIEWAGM